VTGIDFGSIPYIEPRWAGVKELNLGDEWRAVWVGQPSLPKDLPALYGYVVVICDGKGYVSRRAGEARWGAAEGALQAGEKPDAFVKRIAGDMTGAQSVKPHLMGYLECKATTHNRDFKAGMGAVRPVYLAVAAKMKDLGKESPYERRRLPLNEFARELRDRYPELNDAITMPVDRYLVLQAGAG
jgi:hypothetical protein